MTPWLILILAYLLGAIPTGYWLGLFWKGVDVRKQGSGNLGATNVFRVLGKGPGIVTLIIDILKGYIPVALAQHVAGVGSLLAIEAGVLAILGHTTSPFVGFRGGKGVATSAGVFAALLPLPIALAVLAFVVTFGISRYVSLSSIIAAIVLAIAAVCEPVALILKLMAIAVALFVIVKHRSNIQRLRAGTENRFK